MSGSDLDSPTRSYTAQELLGRSLNAVEEKNSPKRLFVAGDAALLRSAPAVSIVGSRKASQLAVETATSLSQWLVDRGILVLSGLAEGVDAAAHTTAIEHGGRTVGVIGTPLTEFYPEKNRALQLRMMREQLVISQFTAGVPTRPGNFPMRNRTMALLSDATVIAEASEKSGSLHQGWEALRLGRPLFLMRSQREDPSLSWPARMEGYGALVLDLHDWAALTEVLPERARGESAEFAF